MIRQGDAGTRRALLVVAALAAALVGLRAGGAHAAPATCPTAQPEAAKISIDTPAADAQVAGRVEVKGRVESDSPVFQLELFVGDARRDVTYLNPPTSAADFAMAWETGSAKPGPATIRVVACGGSQDGLSLISGTASLPVDVLSTAPPPENRALVVAEHEHGENHHVSPVMAVVIIAPAVAGLLYAAGGRRRRR